MHNEKASFCYFLHRKVMAGQSCMQYRLFVMGNKKIYEFLLVGGTRFCYGE